jgi:hypothetical protein
MFRLLLLLGKPQDLQPQETTIEETFLREISKVITTINNDRRNIHQASLKSYNCGMFRLLLLLVVITFEV